MVSIAIDQDLLLRSYQPDDAEELFAVINASRQHLHPWLPWVDHTTRQEHSLHFIQQSLHQMHTQEALPLGIFYNNRIVGGVGMDKWDQAMKKAQIGYWISKDYEGKGIMSRSLAGFITYLFDKVSLNKIEVHFIPGNKRSAKVAERLRFKIEGVIRQSVLRNGQPEDMVIAGLLKSEWKNKQQE